MMYEVRSFNPRPRTGGDTQPILTATLHSRFNPRPRTGGDQGAVTMVVTTVVSIRAPARGATLSDLSLCRNGRGFNPRPRTGGDAGQTTDRRALRFQSAPPHGGRRDPGRLSGPGQSVSIRAPARGATSWLATSLMPSFNPRPRTGGDSLDSCSSSTASTRFNPRPRTGGDRGWRRARGCGDRVSIRAPARGATR